jgi:hypothetical protein
MSNARPSDIFNLCTYQFFNGRLCGLPAHPKGEGLCLTHYRYVTAKPKPREDDLSRELSSPGNDFITQIDINHVLGKLFESLAANRLTPRRASSLAYIAFLMNQTQKGAKDEARLWKKNLPVYKKMLALKYSKDHPNHPDYIEPDPPPPAIPQAEFAFPPHAEPQAPPQLTESAQSPTSSTGLQPVPAEPPSKAQATCPTTRGTDTSVYPDARRGHAPMLQQTSNSSDKTACTNAGSVCSTPKPAAPATQRSTSNRQSKAGKPLRSAVAAAQGRTKSAVASAKAETPRVSIPPGTSTLPKVGAEFARQVLDALAKSKPRLRLS